MKRTLFTLQGFVGGLGLATAIFMFIQGEYALFGMALGATLIVVVGWVLDHLTNKPEEAEGDRIFKRIFYHEPIPDEPHRWAQMLKEAIQAYPDYPAMAMATWESKMLAEGFEFGDPEEGEDGEPHFVLERGDARIVYAIKHDL